MKIPIFWLKSITLGTEFCELKKCIFKSRYTIDCEITGTKRFYQKTIKQNNLISGNNMQVSFIISILLYKYCTPCKFDINFRLILICLKHKIPLFHHTSNWYTSCLPKKKITTQFSFKKREKSRMSFIYLSISILCWNWHMERIIFIFLFFRANIPKYTEVLNLFLIKIQPHSIDFCLIFFRKEIIINPVLHETNSRPSSALNLFLFFFSVFFTFLNWSN